MRGVDSRAVPHAVITSAFGGLGEGAGVGPTCHPVGPVRHHTTHLRLLAHDFGYQHAPRRGPAEAPWQIARIGLPPCAQSQRNCCVVHRSLFLAAMTNEAEQNSQNAQNPETKVEKMFEYGYRKSNYGPDELVTDAHGKPHLRGGRDALG